MNGRWCVGPSLLQGQRKSISGSQTESRIQTNCGWASISASQYLTGHTQTLGVGVGGGGGVRGCGWVAQCYPGVSACCQSPTRGAPFRGGSWGFLGEEGGCAGDCDAWGVCRSGRGCGCHGECHRGSGRSRWPFRWVLAGRSQSALWSFQERGRKQWDRND